MALCVTRSAIIHAQMVLATKILGDVAQEAGVCLCIRLFHEHCQFLIRHLSNDMTKLVCDFSRNTALV